MPRGERDVNLLQKTRKINQLLQENRLNKSAFFNELLRALSEVLNADTLIAGKNGKVLGYSLREGFFNQHLQNIVEKGQLPDDCTEKLLTITTTVPNLGTNVKDLSAHQDGKPFFERPVTTVIPIYGGGERLGTMFLTKYGTAFNEDDLIIGEYGAAAIGFKILCSKAEEREEKERNKASTRMAISSLSYSELEAVEHIFAELDGAQGLIIASNIADRKKLTRSVIVNALRKLEGAGIISTRSLGMKGTYIKVLNNEFLKELEALKV